MYSTLAINNSDVAMGTIALTIKRKDLYVEAAEGGGAERGSARKKRGEEDTENEKVWENWCERSEGVAEGLSGNLFVRERAARVRGTPARVRLEAFKPSPSVSMYPPPPLLLPSV